MNHCTRLPLLIFDLQGPTSPSPKLWAPLTGAWLLVWTDNLWSWSCILLPMTGSRTGKGFCWWMLQSPRQHLTSPQAVARKKSVRKHKYHCRTPMRCLRRKLTWGELRQLPITKQDYLEMRPITVPKPHSIFNYARVLDPSLTRQHQQGGHWGLGSALHIL